MGLKPLMETPLKVEYLRRDILRLAGVRNALLLEALISRTLMLWRAFRCRSASIRQACKRRCKMKAPGSPCAIGNELF